eukprot:s3533_g1.t1
MRPPRALLEQALWQCVLLYCLPWVFSCGFIGYLVFSASVLLIQVVNPSIPSSHGMHITLPLHVMSGWHLIAVVCWTLRGMSALAEPSLISPRTVWAQKGFEIGRTKMSWQAAIAGSDSEFEEIFAEDEPPGSPPRGPPVPRPIQEDYEGRALSCSLSAAISDCLNQRGVSTMLAVSFVAPGTLESGQIAIRIERMRRTECRTRGCSGVQATTVLKQKQKHAPHDRLVAESPRSRRRNLPSC